MSEGVRTMLYSIQGLLYVAAAITLMVCMQIITRDAGVRTVAGRWALLRRFLYASAWISLFVLGINRLDDPQPIDFGDAIPQMIVVLYILIFPLLRATKIITQDHWAIGNGVQRVLDKVFDGDRLANGNNNS